jgi:hypothetical protein
LKKIVNRGDKSKSGKNKLEFLRSTKASFRKEEEARSRIAANKKSSSISGAAFFI